MVTSLVATRQRSFQMFWKYDLCDNYLEAIKPILQGTDEELKQQTLNTLLKCLETGLRLLHPMMPYLSEELYQKIPDFQNKFCSLPISKYPEADLECIDEGIENDFEILNKIAQGIRTMRSSVNLPLKNLPTCYLIVENEERVKQIVLEQQFVLCTLSRAKEVVTPPRPFQGSGTMNQPREMLSLLASQSAGTAPLNGHSRVLLPLWPDFAQSFL